MWGLRVTLCGATRCSNLWQAIVLVLPEPEQSLVWTTYNPHRDSPCSLGVAGSWRKLKPEKSLWLRL